MLDDFWVHSVRIAPYLGAGSHGDTFGEAVTVTGFVSPGERVITQADGRERRAAGTIYLPSDTHVPANSKISCQHPSLKGRAIEVIDWDAGLLPLPEAVEVIVA